MLARRAASQPHYCSSRILIPVRSAEADKRGDEVDSTVVARAYGHRFSLCCGRYYFQSVAQPLDGGPGNEDAAFERVLNRSFVNFPRDGCEQIIFRGDFFAPRIEQHEASRPVSVFRHARRDADLAEEGRLLIARNARDWNRASEK